jgi:hypothetical protein
VSTAPRILFVDGGAGAAGDMILAALLDLGVPLPPLRRALGTLPLPTWSLSTTKVERDGLAARLRARASARASAAPARPGGRPRRTRSCPPHPSRPGADRARGKASGACARPRARRLPAPGGGRGTGARDPSRQGAPPRGGGGGCGDRHRGCLPGPGGPGSRPHRGVAPHHRARHGGQRARPAPRPRACHQHSWCGASPCRRGKRPASA